jgi:hypothetical protein
VTASLQWENCCGLLSGGVLVMVCLEASFEKAKYV